MTSRKKEEKREKSMKKEKAVFNTFQTTRTRQKERGILCWRLLNLEVLLAQSAKILSKISPSQTTVLNGWKCDHDVISDSCKEFLFQFLRCYHLDLWMQALDGDVVKCCDFLRSLGQKNGLEPRYFGTNDKNVFVVNRNWSVQKSTKTEKG